MEELFALLAPDFAPHLTGVAFYAVLVLLGTVIGLMTGFFGVGGGFLTVPLLNIILGIPYEIAVGSDLCFIVGTSVSGFLRQTYLNKVDFRAVACIAGGSITGAVVGDIVQDALIHSVAGGERAVFTNIMHVLFLVLLSATAFIILKKRQAYAAAGGRTVLQRFSFGPSVDLSHPGLDDVNLIGMIVAGFFIGVLTGVMGIGGGVLMVPVLLVLVGLPADKASGTSLGIIFLAAFAGVVKKSLSSTPKISLPVTMALLVASVIGVQIGIKLVQNIDTRRFRKYFSVVIFAAIVLILFDLLLF